MNAPARLDVAWNAASGALDASRTWASAASPFSTQATR